MIPLSGRYGKHLIVLLLLLAVPMLAAELRPRRRDDCRDPALLFVTSLIEGSKPVGESMPGDSADVIQWSYGELANPQSPRNPLRFQIVRSYDRAYTELNPLLGAPFEAEVHAVEEVQTSSGRIPIHLAIDHTKEPSRLAAWTFVYDGRPVETPLFSILASAPRQLVGGYLPLTILMVDGTTSRGEVEPAAHAATEWLVAAWQHVAMACQ
jgi:hypothetical protein